MEFDGRPREPFSDRESGPPKIGRLLWSGLRQALRDIFWPNRLSDDEVRIITLECFADDESYVLTKAIRDGMVSSHRNARIGKQLEADGLIEYKERPHPTIPGLTRYLFVTTDKGDARLTWLWMALWREDVPRATKIRALVRQAAGSNVPARPS